MDRTARFLSLVGSPPILGTLFFTVLALVGGAPAYVAVGVSWVLMIFLPSAALLLLVAKGQIQDREMSDVRDRRRFMPVALLFGVAALFLAIRLHFPLAVKVSVVGMSLWLFFGTLVGQFWKVSLHVSGTTGIFWLSLVFFGPGALLLIWLPPAVAWSRLRLDHHDLWQVWGGAALGTACAFAGLLVGPH